MNTACLNQENTVSILKIDDAARHFYKAGMSYHNTITVRRARKVVGVVFVFDKSSGFDEVVSEFCNVERVVTRKSYAPEIKKPALLVYTQAEIKRRRLAELSIDRMHL